MSEDTGIDREQPLLGSQARAVEPRNSGRERGSLSFALSRLRLEIKFVFLGAMLLLGPKF